VTIPRPRDPQSGVVQAFGRAFFGPGFGEPPEPSIARKIGRAGGILIGIGFILVILGTEAWIAAFVFNQLMTQVG
jgi:hypothetical protein